jgi:hypothetical protein
MGDADSNWSPSMMPALHSKRMNSIYATQQAHTHRKRAHKAQPASPQSTARPVPQSGSVLSRCVYLCGVVLGIDDLGLGDGAHGRLEVVGPLAAQHVVLEVRATATQTSTVSKLWVPRRAGDFEYGPALRVTCTYEHLHSDCGVSSVHEPEAGQVRKPPLCHPHHSNESKALVNRGPRAVLRPSLWPTCRGS